MINDSRRHITEALRDLRTAVPGGHVVDTWGYASFAAYPWAEREAARDAYFDELAAIVDAACGRTEFEPFARAEYGSCPPDQEMHVGWAMARAGAPLASYPAFAEPSADGAIELGSRDSRKAVVYRGPLVLAGAFRVSGAVIVIGDLVIDGSLAVYSDGSANQLVVIGNVIAGALEAAADILISGELTAELLIRTDDHYSLAVGQQGAIGALHGEWGPAAIHVDQLDDCLVTAVAAARQPIVAFGLERVARRPLWKWSAPPATDPIVVASTRIIEFARRLRIEPLAIRRVVEIACADLRVTPSELSVGLDRALERDLFRDPDDVKLADALVAALAGKH